MSSALGNGIAIAIIVFNIIGIVWLGIVVGHPFLFSLGYIIALIIIGNTKGTACVIVLLVVAAITLTVIIVMIVREIIIAIGNANAANNEKKRQEQKTQRNNALLDATNRGDEQTVQNLIENGADVNYIGYINLKNSSGLQIAVENRDKKIILLLIEKGANVNLVCDGKPPLDFAEDEEIISILKSHGAKTKSELEEAAREATYKLEMQRKLSEDLLTAIQKHDRGIAEFLISQGADVNYKTLEGNTPLTFAIYGNDIEIIKLLLKNGADKWEEVRGLFGGSINAINFARYVVKNEDIAKFLENTPR